MRLLDIGCGWGGFAQFAAERSRRRGHRHHPLPRAGTRLRTSAVRATRFASAQPTTAPSPASFDRIVSVGHVRTRRMPKNLRAFFDRCDELLTADGLMLHHTIGSNARPSMPTSWFDRYIFPGGVLPSLAQIAGRRLSIAGCVEDVHNFGPDYDRTLMAWHDNVSEPVERAAHLRRPVPSNVATTTCSARLPDSGSHHCSCGRSCFGGRCVPRGSTPPCGDLHRPTSRRCRPVGSGGRGTRAAGWGERPCRSQRRAPVRMVRQRFPVREPTGENRHDEHHRDHRPHSRGRG